MRVASSIDENREGSAYLEFNLIKNMKTILRCLTAASSALLIGSATVQAQNPNLNLYPNAPYQNAPYYQTQTSPFYLNADVGGSLQQSMSLKNLGARIGFNAGTRGDVSFGYNIINQLAVEFETGFIWNSINNSGPQIISPVADRADLYQVPLLANLVFKVPLRCGLTPYIGAGAGGDVSTLQLTRGSFDDSFDHHRSDTDFTFAYQGMAGLKYALGWNMEVGVGYKFFGTLDHSYFGDQSDLYVHTSPTLSHSILATFTWHF